MLVLTLSLAFAVPSFVTIIFIGELTAVYCGGDDRQVSAAYVSTAIAV